MLEPAFELLAGYLPAKPAMYELVMEIFTPSASIPLPAVRVSVEGNRLLALISAGWMKDRSMIKSCVPMFSLYVGYPLGALPRAALMSIRSGAYATPVLVISSPIRA